jgi:hypothetical protein
MTPRRFPPPWSAEETDACFIVRDHGGQALASQGEVPTLAGTIPRSMAGGFKARGVRFGRPPALTPHQRQEAIQRLAEGHSQADVARSYNVSQATISRLEANPFDDARNVAAA